MVGIGTYPWVYLNSLRICLYTKFFALVFSDQSLNALEINQWTSNILFTYAYSH